ncbi:MAG: hypothetical protein HKP30_03150 [Myxococcales bacterium]|nr:hypothetical protein [Myxococcales bacterium]
MSRRVRITEVLTFLGVDRGELLESLREEGLFEADELPPEEAEELRVAAVLMQDLGVNAAGVEVVLRLRRRLMLLQGAAEEALRRRALDERGPRRR